MDIRVFDKIPDEARIIRETVFLDEQGFEKEYDENDNVAKHIVIYDEKNAIATCRVYWDDEVNCYHVGRIAVLKPHRGKGLGIKIVTEAEKLKKLNLLNISEDCILLTEKGYLLSNIIISQLISKGI